MLRTVAVSSNKKTGPIATTYRSGQHETYGTCPKTCSLHPKSETGTAEIDQEYLNALYDAVPEDGKAWTYSHFAHNMLPRPQEGKTVINASCDTVEEAIAVTNDGYPAVHAAPAGTQWPQVIDNVKFLRCPADMSSDFTCKQCGNGNPLCARVERDYVIVFVAHGTGAKKVGTGTGGCYAASGPTAIQWHGTKKQVDANDAKKIVSFARSLPAGSFLRHHVAGDIGREVA